MAHHDRIQNLRGYARRGPAPLVSALLVGALVVAGATMILADAVAETTTERLEQSPQWRDGRFENALPEQNGSMLVATWKFMTAGEGRVPDAPVDIMNRTGSDFDGPPSTGLRVTWLGHSTFLVEIDGARVLIDPVWSERVSPFSFMGPKRFFPLPMSLDEVPDVDAVVISHDHFDHLDEPTIVSLNERGLRFLAPLGVGAHLESWGVPGERITELDWWKDADVGVLTLTATPARHFSNRSITMLDKNKTLWSGWAIQGPAHSIYYSGDTAMFPGFVEIGERLGPFDANIVEIGAYGSAWPDVHLGPEQAMDAHMQLGGGLLIPAHWGTFNLSLHSWTEPIERLLVAAEQAGADVAAPRPGQSVEPAASTPPTQWWPGIPWRTVDQAPVVSTGLREP